VIHDAAVIGCGRIAGRLDSPRSTGPVRTHAQAYHRHPSLRLVAACDSKREVLEGFCRTWNVPKRYGSFAELLDAEHPSVVSICTQTSSHFQDLKTALTRSKPPLILVEKPLCQTRPELAELCQLVDASAEATVVVNHSRRFDRAHRRLAALISGQAFGTLVQGRCVYYGGWLNNGSHLVDTLRMLIGPLTFERVVGRVSGRPEDPCLDVQLRSGDAVIVAEGFDENFYQIFEIDLRFTGGRVVIRDFGAQIIIESPMVNELGERVLVPSHESPWSGLDAPMLEAVTAIVEQLEGRSSVHATGATLAEAAGTMQLLWQAMDAA
jgi:predicted dehydrogenase